MKSRIPNFSISFKQIIVLLTIATLMGLLPTRPEAQIGQTSMKSTLSDIENNLHHDRTPNIKNRYSGSLDMQGRTVAIWPSGPPRFVLDASAGDTRWAQNFGAVGRETSVKALVVDHIGNIYAAGDFSCAGGIETGTVAKWNGSEWSSLGFGSGGYGWASIDALAVDKDGNLYVGGSFSEAGGVRANNIAKWNGTEWSALGSGMNHRVNALVMDTAGNLYAGGEFDHAGGIEAYFLAKWNGNKWSALGPQSFYPFLWGFVTALAVDGSENLYAIDGEKIAKWNGKAWSNLGQTFSYIYALAVDGSGNLYAGGWGIIEVGGVAANGIAKWDGSSWSALGDGMESVFALAVDGNGNLYAGGYFCVAKWNGNEWSALVAGIDGTVSALLIDGEGNIHAGGEFITAGEAVVNSIAKWNGNEWSALGSGMFNYGYVNASAIDGNGNVYIGGSFITAGGVPARNIAKWDGSAWSALEAGVNGTVYALAVDGGGNVFVGGRFSSVARWDGNAWFALGSGMQTFNGDVCVYAITVDGQGNLYAGGEFTQAGEANARRIAKWNGSEWSRLASGVDGPVYSLATDASGNLYVGGSFDWAGSVAASSIVKWNGKGWSTLGSGIDGTIYALGVDGEGNLFAGGLFKSAGGVDANNIAKWNGSAWSALGSGMYIPDLYADSTVNSLAVDGNENLYAGGYFSTAGGATASHIARWDGSAWSALGSGMNAKVLALALDGSGNLYVGGDFTSSAGAPLSNIAQWRGKSAIAVDFASSGLFLWSRDWQGKISSSHPAILGTWGDRLVASFPTMGLYLHDGSTWIKISSLRTAKSVVGIGDSLYVDFGTGIYRYKNNWSKTYGVSPSLMASYAGKLVASFPGKGVYEYNGSAWKKISSWTTAEQMIGIEGRLFVDFGSLGLYRKDGNGAWVKTTVSSPVRMHAFGKILAASFDSGSTRGIYLYRNKSWEKISSDPTAEAFASTPFILYVDRGSLGLSKYEKKAWTIINPQDPDGIAMYGSKLVADFPVEGLSSYANPGWSTLSPNNDAGLMQGVLFK
ncbi:MAG: hypothetical protein AB9866_15115 [Syntrophobacteraceae bacterium]